MKLLTGLVVAQFVLIGLLFARISALESNVVTSIASADNAPASLNNTRSMPVVGDRSPRPASTLDEDRLREIIREELDAARPATAADAPRVAAAPDPQREIEYDYKLDEVRQTLDFYTQIGQISPAEMARLQTDIAKLRPADREAMLSRLVRELNTGAIDGRL